MLGITDQKLGLLFLVVGLFLVAGVFLDAVANMIILRLLLYPVCVTGLGMDPIQYGEFLMIGLLLGILHSPIGLLLFVVAPMARVSLERLSLAILPFLIIEIACLLVVALVPDLTLALPRLAGYVRE